MDLTNKKVYFDTNPLIYFLEKDRNLYPIVLPYFEQLANNQIIGVASHLVISELMIKPLRSQNLMLQ